MVNLSLLKKRPRSHFLRCTAPTDRKPSTMTFIPPFNRIKTGSQTGYLVYGFSKDSGTVFTEDETRFTSYEWSDSSNGTSPQLNPNDNHRSSDRKHQQIEEEESSSSSGSVSSDSEMDEASCTSGKYTYTSTASSSSSGWDSDLESLMIWMNDTIVNPKVHVPAWMRTQVDGTSRHRMRRSIPVVPKLEGAPADRQVNSCGNENQRYSVMHSGTHAIELHSNDFTKRQEVEVQSVQPGNINPNVCLTEQWARLDPSIQVEEHVYGGGGGGGGGGDEEEVEEYNDDDDSLCEGYEFTESSSSGSYQSVGIQAHPSTRRELCIIQGFQNAANKEADVNRFECLTLAGVDPAHQLATGTMAVLAPRTSPMQETEDINYQEDPTAPTGTNVFSNSSGDDYVHSDDVYGGQEEDWSIDEEELNEHKEFVDGELERKKAYGGWRSIASTHSTCSSISDLDIPREISSPAPDVLGQASFSGKTVVGQVVGPPREISSPAADVIAQASFVATSRSATPKNSILTDSRQLCCSRRNNSGEGNSDPCRSGSLGTYLTNSNQKRQVSFGESKMTLESDSTDLSYHVDLPDAVDVEDITDEYLKKVCGKLYRKLNHDPWDEFNKYRDEDVSDFVRLHPETCKVRYDFEHFSSKLFPLSMLCSLNATRSTMELVHEAFEDAVKEEDLCIGTPLHYAATYKAKPSVVEFLVEAEESMLMSPNQFGRTPLHMACLFKAPSKTVALLVSECPSATQVVDKDGCSPLHLACEHGANNAVIRRLVAANPSMCLSGSTNGSTPLHLSCLHGTSRATTRTLIQAHPEAAGYQDLNGMTPLHVAAQANAPVAIIEMLVKASPGSVEKESARGQTALRIAKHRKASFAIQKLLGA